MPSKNCFFFLEFMKMSSMFIFSLLLSLSTLHIIISPSCSTKTVVPKTRKLSLRLIHRDAVSLTSPRRSAKPKLPDMSEDDVRAPIFPMEDGSIFLVNVSIGNPPIPQLMAMDTGSRLTWIRCRTCDGCKNVFDPKKSSTYSALPRDSPQCLHYKYGPQNQQLCTFGFTYQDLSSSVGIVGLEKFTFLTSSGGTMELPDLVFGCAQRTSGTVVSVDGILALEVPDKYCLTARTGYRFSYCIGNINDLGYMYNQLILGDGAVLEGDSTPMQIKDSHYVVTLEGISVGETRLAIDPREFLSNVVVDSGTTYTELRRSAYRSLVAEVEELMDGVVARTLVRNAETQLCYRGDIERDLKGFPIVTLHLAEGTDIELDVDAMFQKTKDGLAFCMAVVEANENIIGVKAQQYYNVGFDLDAMRISFQRIDCQLLEE
ncbi:aspartyl protease UND [Andrographis paniculata]|uniref:aspartyl protease UND n=1 Tax=Andrographis paniculata TaxID=175694 RepID=UPI0021E8016E|nr:aspartyl protease UND [Andrographis paniculata]